MVRRSSMRCEHLVDFTIGDVVDVRVFDDVRIGIVIDRYQEITTHHYLVLVGLEKLPCFQETIWPTIDHQYDVVARMFGYWQKPLCVSLGDRLASSTSASSIK